MTIDLYPGAVDPARVTQDDVRQALRFLVSVEPVRNTVSSRAEYEAATTEFAEQIHLANDTLRRYALQGQPADLQDMQNDYYEIISAAEFNDDGQMLSVVRGSLDMAWHGVGPWQR